MKHFLSFLFLLFSMSVVGKEPMNAEFFKMDGDAIPEFRCYLMLYNGEYCIEMDPIDVEGSLYVMSPSCGHYTEEEGIYQLVDDDYGCAMRLQRTSPAKVILSHTMPFLEGSSFTLMSHDFPEWYPYEPTDPSQLHETLAEHNKRFPKKYKVRNGIYASKQNKSLGCEIELRDDSLYTLTYKGMTISCGSFSRDVNAMKLHDAGLDYDFYALICDYRIKGVNFPLITDSNLNYCPEANCSNDSVQSPSSNLFYVLLAILAAAGAFCGIFCYMRKRPKNA